MRMTVAWRLGPDAQRFLAAVGIFTGRPVACASGDVNLRGDIFFAAKAPPTAG